MTPIPPATPSPPGPAQVTPLAGAYLAAFRLCPKAGGVGCADAEHEIRFATSQDGGNFTAFPNATPLGSGTPEAIRRGDTLYVYERDQVHRYDIANGTWRAPETVTYTNANGTAAIGLNASAILDPEGRIVLFHLFARPGQDAGCGELPVCTKTFRSATEIDGSDGARFLVDAGNRATAATNTTASDPDIFAHPGGYVMLISVGPGVRVYTSTDLRGTYAFRDFLTNASGHTPTGHYDAASQRYWIYVQHGGNETPMEVRRAILASLDDPVPDDQFVRILTDRGAPSIAPNTV